MAPILELREVTKRFPGHTVVDGVSLSIAAGEFFALLGPSGCGKTTTLRMVAGLEEPTAGGIHLAGVRINHRRPHERNVSTVFQNYALFPHMTVQANIEFGLKQRGVRDLARKVRAVLELVKLDGKQARRPDQISGGERQRVALARSLVVEPDVLLLDEPLSALDPKLRKQVRTELKSLQRRVGITFLLVTHDQEEALSMADRMGVMRRGRIEQVGTPQELYQRPASRFVASFLGGINWVGGRGVRPEAIHLARGGAPGGTRSSEGVVESTLFLGNCVQVYTRLSSGELIVADAPRQDGSYQPGEPVCLWWNAADELVFDGTGDEESD